MRLTTHSNVHRGMATRSIKASMIQSITMTPKFLVHPNCKKDVARRCIVHHILHYEPQY